MTANGGDTLDTLMNHPAESERKKRGHARLGGPAEKRVAKLRARRKAKDRCPSRASSNSSFCPLASPPLPPPSLSLSLSVVPLFLLSSLLFFFFLFFFLSGCVRFSSFGKWVTNFFCAITSRPKPTLASPSWPTSHTDPPRSHSRSRPPSLSFALLEGTRTGPHHRSRVTTRAN